MSTLLSSCWEIITACSNKNITSAITCSDTCPFTALYKITKTAAWKTLDFNICRGSSYASEQSAGVLNGGQGLMPGFSLFACLALVILSN